MSTAFRDRHGYTPDYPDEASAREAADRLEGEIAAVRMDLLARAEMLAEAIRDQAHVKIVVEHADRIAQLRSDLSSAHSRVVRARQDMWSWRDMAVKA
jgi:hypothetical protein